MLRVEVQGLRELNDRLKAFTPELAKKPIPNALRKIGKSLQAAAKSRVPVRTGALRDNIIVTRLRKIPEGQVAMRVTVRAKATKYKDNRKNRRAGRVGQRWQDYGPLFYARFLELGTSKMSAHPFLRPAFEELQGTLPEQFREALAADIEKIAIKLGGKAR